MGKVRVAYLPAVVETNPASAALKIYEALSACERRRLSPVDDEEERALEGVFNCTLAVYHFEGVFPVAPVVVS